MTAFFGILLGLQAQAIATAPPVPGATTVQATRTGVPPVLDGRDDDVIWRTAPAIDQFLEARPTEGAPARLRTEARVGYDEHNLYVFVRAFDPHPDSIVGLLARRDEETPSDYITLMLDPYHDRRTGYEFQVNAAGVKIGPGDLERWRRGRRVGDPAVGQGERRRDVDGAVAGPGGRPEGDAAVGVQGEGGVGPQGAAVEDQVAGRRRRARCRGCRRR